jgi:uncharacterized protein (TIGR00255 family)
MIKSMTGFAAVTREDDLAAVAVSVRTLNHRYLDLQIRIPQSLAPVESDIRALVGRSVARGRVELTVSVQLRQAPSVEIDLNEEFSRALEAALDRARKRGIVSGSLTPGDLLRMPQALTIRERPATGDPQESSDVSTRVTDAVKAALEDLDVMRKREGDFLRADVEQRRVLVADLVERIAEAAEAGRARLEERLAERVQQLRADIQADEAAVAQEIVRTASRSDISEEVARFRGHVAHWAALSDSLEPCGRKLDFLLQEMNREVNTMGSKADGLRVSELIIAAKAELEKMREQVQNVE